MTITGTGTKSALTRDATFKITLLDPCDPPSSISPPGISAYTYTLTDQAAVDKTHLAFTVEPVYCEVEYSSEISKFTNSQGGEASAVTDNND